MKKIAYSLIALAAALARATIASPAPSSDPVVQWNRLLLEMVRTPGVQPATVHPTRSFAMMHAAIYDAVNNLQPTHTPYSVELNPGPGIPSEQAAAAAAAHEVLIHLYPAAQAQLDTQLQQSLAPIPDGPEKTQGISLGELMADRVLTLRTNDGANATPAPYVFGTAPGEFQSPPPAFPPQPQFSHWAKVTPFALASADQFRPGPPPGLLSGEYAKAFNEIEASGVTNSTTATADEALTGRFWNGAIQNYWNEIAQTAAQDRGLSTAQSARLFALLNLALADSVIAFYDAKYTYNLWRPVTAIRAAETDGNPDTAADPAWLPEVGKTAPDPSYPGAHGAISAAAAEILDLFFHKDRAEITVTSESLPNVERSFTSFSAAAREASLSRIFAGQHFRFDQVAGEQLGRAVAEYVAENFLTPRSQSGGYDQHNLISDLPGLADSVDTNLVNPWGIVFSAESPFWIADNHGGVSTIYTGDAGALGTIRIPGVAEGSPSAPTGVVFNNTTNLIGEPDQPVRFIFSGEDGTLSAWSSGTNATLVADNSTAHAIYKGLALATVGDHAFLYAPDFHNGRIDVFDGQFKLAVWPGAFVDPDLPPGFAPFGVGVVGTNLFVSYALQDPDREDDIPGPGHGCLDIFDTRGHFIRRFASGAPLNSPWGMALAPAGFGDLGGNLLIGNFGDGKINAFDFETGALVGALLGTNGAPIRIEGLWGLLFGNGISGGDKNTLYFTAGIGGGGALEDHGLFGRISPTPPLLLSVSAIGQGQLRLAWTGGAGPYLVQTKPNLSSPNWIDLMTTTNLGANLKADGPAGIFRIIRP